MFCFVFLFSLLRCSVLDENSGTVSAVKDQRFNSTEKQLCEKVGTYLKNTKLCDSFLLGKYTDSENLFFKNKSFAKDLSDLNFTAKFYNQMMLRLSGAIKGYPKNNNTLCATNEKNTSGDNSSSQNDDYMPFNIVCRSYLATLKCSYFYIRDTLKLTLLNKAKKFNIKSKSEENENKEEEAKTQTIDVRNIFNEDIEEEKKEGEKKKGEKKKKEKQISLELRDDNDLSEIEIRMKGFILDFLNFFTPIIKSRTEVFLTIFTETNFEVKDSETYKNLLQNLKEKFEKIEIKTLISKELNEYLDDENCPLDFNIVVEPKEIENIYKETYKKAALMLRNLFATLEFNKMIFLSFIDEKIKEIESSSATLQAENVDNEVQQSTTASEACDQEGENINTAEIYSQ